jgi:hypothetical protein
MKQKKSKYIKRKHSKIGSTFLFNKEYKKEMYLSSRERINSRRISKWKIKYKTRVFDHNMIEGLCFGNFYGRQKIIYKRLYGREILVKNTKI